MLEAGKQLDMTAELKSMEWPYDHPRRGEMPYDSHALAHERVHVPPAALRAKDSPLASVHSYIQGWSGSRTTRRTSWWTRRSTPTRHALRLGARALPGGQDQHLGPARPAPLRLRLQGEEPRRLRRGLADLLRRPRSPTTTRWTSTSASPATPRAWPTCPTACSSARRGSTPPRSGCASRWEARARAHAVPGGGDDRRPQAQQVPQPLLRARGLQPPRGRVRHPRRLRLPHRPHLPGAGHGPAHPAHRTPSCGR